MKVVFYRACLGQSALLQCQPVVVCRCPPGRAIPVQRGHQSGVNSELCSVPQRQTVRDNFEFPSIEPLDLFQIHVTDKGVRPHSRPCFSAHLCAACSNGNPLPPKTPLHCTLLDDGQKSRVGGHIGRWVRSRERAMRSTVTGAVEKVELRSSSSCWWGPP